MKLKEFIDPNTEKFLREAFQPASRKKLIRATRLRRNIYLALFLTGFLCIFVAGFIGQTVLSILSLFLATLSLVVMTKYDTQFFFLILLDKKEPAEEKVL